MLHNFTENVVLKSAKFHCSQTNKRLVHLLCAESLHWKDVSRLPWVKKITEKKEKITLGSLFTLMKVHLWYDNTLWSILISFVSGGSTTCLYNQLEQHEHNPSTTTVLLLVFHSGDYPLWHTATCPIGRWHMGTNKYISVRVVQFPLIFQSTTVEVNRVRNYFWKQISLHDKVWTYVDLSSNCWL